MATIISKPGSIAMSGNIKDIIVDSSTEINFEIQEVGGSTILEETYQPDANNKITIRLRDLLPSLLSLQLPTSDVFEQTNAVKNYNFIVEGTAVPTKVVFGGVDADADPEVFLKGNWLTWQPQQKSVKYNDPEWLTYYAVVATVVKVKAYFTDKDPEVITLTTLASGKEYSLNASFAYLSGKFTGQPVYFDIWNEDTVGTQLAFVQRFVLFNDYFEHEDLFVVDNSLGGLDTFRFTGKKEDINDFDIESALFDEDTMDYDVEFEKYFKKNTGYFADDRIKTWTQEFFNSLKRYYCADTGYQSITVSKPKAKSVQGDITTYNYDFEFALSRQTKYLNLSRANELPTEVQIVDPDSELFFLAPRLVEFASATITDQLLLPVQVPFAENWEKLSFGELKAAVIKDVKHVDITGYAKEQWVIDKNYATKEWIESLGYTSDPDLTAYATQDWVQNQGYLSQQDLSNYDLHTHNNKIVLDALDFNGNYLERNGGEVWVANTDKLGNIIAADYFNKYNADLPTVNWEMADAIVNGTFTTKNFAPGIIGGVGGRMDQAGNMELQSLIVREFIRTPELIKNQVRVAGNEFWFTDPGIIQEVSGTGPYTITYKIEEGDGVSHKVDDILIGIYNDGNGFETAYFDVVSVDLANNQAVLNSRNGIAPSKYMVLARKGNKTNTDRQTSVFVDGLNGYMRVLGNVSDHNTDFSNIIAQLGYLNMHSPVFGDMDKGLYVKDFGYFENVRVSGEIHVTGGNAETQTGAQDKANLAQSQAEAYALAKANLAEIQAKAYADGEVSAAEQRAISEAQAKVDSLEIGGRNYYKTSTLLAPTSHSPTIRINTDESPNGFHITGQPGVESGVRINQVIDDNGQYTISFWGKSNNPAINVDFDICDRLCTTEDNLFTQEWKRFEYKATVDNHSEIYSFVDIRNIKYVHYYFKDFKIEKGNKATDWSPAPEDVEANIAASQTNAESYALAKADLAEVTAKAYADGEVSAAEQRAINEAQVKVDALANTLGDLSYQDKVELAKLGNSILVGGFLKTDLINVGELFVGTGGIRIDPSAVISFGQVSGTSHLETQTGAQSKANSAQTNAETYALSKANLAEVTAKAYADGEVSAAEQRAINEAQDKVDAIDIGGRNLYRKTCSVIQLDNQPTIRLDTVDSPNGFHITGESGKVCGVRIKNVIPSNGEYVISFWGKSNNPAINVDFDICDRLCTTEDNLFTQEWKRFEYRATVDNHSEIYSFVDIRNIKYVHYYFKDFKIEKGNKATDWSPAPEDVDAEIATKITNAEATVITENTIATTTVIAEQMKVRAVNIIDKLTAPQIDVDSLMVKNVKTASVGKRIEIDAASNTLKFTDSDGFMSVLIDDYVYGSHPGIKMYNGVLYMEDSTDLTFIKADGIITPSIKPNRIELTSDSEIAINIGTSWVNGYTNYNGVYRHQIDKFYIKNGLIYRIDMV